MAKNNHLLADIPVKAWIQHDGKVLLIQELDEFDGQWCLPGGRIDVGEMPREAMVREIKEELNLDATVGDILDCNIFTGKTGKAHFIVVFAVTIDPQQTIITEDGEVSKAEWIAIDDVKHLKLRPEYIPIIERLTR